MEIGIYPLVFLLFAFLFYIGKGLFKIVWVEKNNTIYFLGRIGRKIAFLFLLSLGQDLGSIRNKNLDSFYLQVKSSLIRSIYCLKELIYNFLLQIKVFMRNGYFHRLFIPKGPGGVLVQSPLSFF
ncbi:hypothetical protein CHRY9293_03455 [Chryseobacterium potabilaquae]|uniref:Uncharacterized protein n=1 Tax=Chryseobacterium potabilaquae TaxID=2675057 RepID=A0A6N4X8G4_9FLAO|nr:hypothetical protein CHRY9293_03455 [Chryseobacterium potabilaquae]